MPAVIRESYGSQYSTTVDVSEGYVRATPVTEHPNRKVMLFTAFRNTSGGGDKSISSALYGTSSSPSLAMTEVLNVTHSSGLEAGPVHIAVHYYDMPTYSTYAYCKITLSGTVAFLMTAMYVLSNAKQGAVDFANTGVNSYGGTAVAVYNVTPQVMNSLNLSNVIGNSESSTPTSNSGFTRSAYTADPPWAVGYEHRSNKQSKTLGWTVSAGPEGMIMCVVNVGAASINSGRYMPNMC